MTLQEASAASGYAVWTLQKFARENEFGAWKPRGRKGGWQVDEPSFRAFMRRRKLKGANDFMKNQIKRGARA